MHTESERETDTQRDRDREVQRQRDSQTHGSELAEPLPCSGNHHSTQVFGKPD